MTIPKLFCSEQTKTTGSWKSLFTSEKVFTNIGRPDSLNSLFFLLALGKGNVRDVRKQTGKFIFSLSTTKKHTRSIPGSLVMHTRKQKQQSGILYLLKIPSMEFRKFVYSSWHSRSVTVCIEHFPARMAASSRMWLEGNFENIQVFGEIFFWNQPSSTEWKWIFDLLKDSFVGVVAVARRHDVINWFIALWLITLLILSSEMEQNNWYLLSSWILRIPL